MSFRSLASMCVLLGLGGCGGLFESTMPATQSYVLRLPPPSMPALATPAAGSVRVQRPEPGPGLDSDRIVLLRSERRFDVYAATRWAAPAPDLLEDVIVDQLRGAGLFSGVFDDSSPYAPQYTLRCGLDRFEADYASGGGEPTIHVALDCSFGRHRDRALLANFIAQGTAAASDDRVGAVVEAFERATVTAMGELQRNVADALAAEKPQ